MQNLRKRDIHRNVMAVMVNYDADVKPVKEGWTLGLKIHNCYIKKSFFRETLGF